MKRRIFISTFASILLLSACGQTDEVTSNDQESTQDSFETENLTSTEFEAEEENGVEVAADVAAEVVNEPKEAEGEAGSIPVEAYVNELSNLIDYESEGSLDLSNVSIDYMTAHPEYFFYLSEESREEVKNLSETLDVRELNKSASPHFEKMLTYQGYVIQIQEHYYEDDGDYLTYALIEDENYNIFTVYLFDRAEGIYEDDLVTFYGLPLGAYSFANVSGGFTNSQMFLGTTIHK